LLRCPGPPCNLGPHCWRDPFGKKHYKLRTHHLKALVELIQQGYTLMGHDDVPKDIREQLYAEEQQWRECQSTRIGVPTPSLLPINITNFLPTQPMSLTCPPSLKTLQQSNIVDDALKEEFQKACDATLDDELDLEQVCEDQDPGFFVQSGINTSCRTTLSRLFNGVTGRADRMA
jgi:hypothetical protein